MSTFVQIKPEEFEQSPFKIIGKDWMLVTAEDDHKANTMTASWGGFGVMWNKNVAYIVIRPQRYTKEFVDNADTFSLTFLDNSFRKTLGYLGAISGRDEDKIQKSGLTLQHFDGTPYFEEANMVVICKKLYHQRFEPGCFIDPSLSQEWYPTLDHHVMYIAEVTHILTKQ